MGTAPGLVVIATKSQNEERTSGDTQEVRVHRNQTKEIKEEDMNRTMNSKPQPRLNYFKSCAIHSVTQEHPIVSQLSSIE